MESITDIYKGWTISVQANDEMCANYSFDISNPSGYRQHVEMGGITIESAVRRAREMIDMEIAMQEED